MKMKREERASGIFVASFFSNFGEGWRKKYEDVVFRAPSSSPSSPLLRVLLFCFQNYQVGTTTASGKTINNNFQTTDRTIAQEYSKPADGDALLALHYCTHLFLGETCDFVICLRLSMTLI